MLRFGLDGMSPSKEENVASKLGQVLRDIEELTTAEQRQVREALNRLIERPAPVASSPDRDRLEDGLMRAIADARKRAK